MTKGKNKFHRCARRGVFRASWQTEWLNRFFHREKGRIASPFFKVDVNFRPESAINLPRVEINI